jgi:hypothetical protein
LYFKAFIRCRVEAYTKSCCAHFCGGVIYQALTSGLIGEWPLDPGKKYRHPAQAGMTN